LERTVWFSHVTYGQLARNLNIPRPTLSSRLRTLVDAGLLERVQYAHDPDRHEYRLTDAGRDLFPAIVTLMRWGDALRAGSPPRPGTLRLGTMLRASCHPTAVSLASSTIETIRLTILYRDPRSIHAMIAPLEIISL
jgi:DNA-binding MarR family transcriptional regulator